MVNHFVINNNGSDDDAKDVYQEGMIVLYEKLQDDQFELNCLIKTFLYSVCRRIWLKKLIYKSRFIGNVTDHEEFEVMDDSEIEDWDKKENEISKMGEAVLKLGEPCSSIITEFYINKSSMQAICEKFGYTNSDNAKTQKYKCLTRLKKIFFANYNR